MNIPQKIELTKDSLRKNLNFLLNRDIPTNHTYNIKLELGNVSQLQEEILEVFLGIMEDNAVNIINCSIEND
jgi:hypothetical protein